MRWSRWEAHTLREVAAEAGAIHRKLMLRAGLIRKDGESLPLGLRSIRKLEALVREETLTRILHNCALDPVPVACDTGTRLVVPTGSGELRFLSCPGCGAAADFDAAASKVSSDEPELVPAEPLTELHTPGAKTIAALGLFLGKPPSQLVKSLVYDTGDGPVLVLVPGDREASEAKIRKHLGVETLAWVDASRFEEVTGGVAGYCGPVGTKCARVVADASLRGRRRWITGANRIDYHHDYAVPGRDFPEPEFAEVTAAAAGDACARCGAALEVRRGIEVAIVHESTWTLDIERTLAAVVEQHHDEDGIVWPVAIAPFSVIVTIVGKDEQVHAAANDIYEQLLRDGVDVLLDDRDERPGVKFKDADLIGFPLRVAVGAKSLANGQVEWSRRSDREKHFGTPEEVVEIMKSSSQRVDQSSSTS